MTKYDLKNILNEDITIEIGGYNYLISEEYRNRVSRNCCGRKNLYVDSCLLIKKIDNEYKTYKGYALFHYNSLITIIIPELLMVFENKWYYDYSSSTSNARNAFTKYLLHTDNIASTRQLRKAEKHKVVYILNETSYHIINFPEYERSRR